MGEIDIERLTMEQYLGWMERVPAGSVKTWELVKRFSFSDIVYLPELRNNWRIFKISNKKGMRLYTRPRKVATKNSLDTYCATSFNSNTILVHYNVEHENVKRTCKSIKTPRSKPVIGLGNPKRVRTLIDMADKSMSSPKGIIENILVKIDKFIFLVDSVILDIVEDDKVLIILGRPMLANAHARN
uniref:Uncharacterized protein n=1 Tax=Tanacetum cinerariifolium TaxID=118510 RepID=A0A699GRB5_TANCI|nr:hypothetical protein [Tanacetum cinerariifolium]